MSKPERKHTGKAQPLQAAVPPTPPDYPSLPSEWEAFSRALGDEGEQLAVETKALVRKRKVRSAGDLLRLILAYAVWDWSLQLVGAWATVLGVGSLSAVAIRQRLCHSRVFVSRLLGRWLARAAAPLAGRAVRLRLIDATVITRPGSTGTDWRVHVSFDVGALRLDEFELTDAQGGESLARHLAAPGDILVGDRIYGQPNGLGPVLAAGAQVVVRINGHSLPMETAAGERIDLRHWLTRVPNSQQQQTRWVWLTTPQGRFRLRLVARRLPPAKAQATRRRALKASRKQGHTPSATTRVMAGWVVVVSNLPPADWTPTAVLALYRIRWQVELLIKRCKSLLHLDALRVQDPDLAQVYLLGKALGLVLLHDGLRADVQAVAEWFTNPGRPLSAWRWLAFWWEHLRALIRGPLSLPMIQTALPKLDRYLCDAPRKRRQQLAAIHLKLTQLNIPQGHPALA